MRVACVCVFVSVCGHMEKEAFLRATSPGLCSKVFLGLLPRERASAVNLHRAAGPLRRSSNLAVGGQRVGWDSEVGMKVREAGRSILLDLCI